MSSNSSADHLKKEILIRLVEAFDSEDFVQNARLIPYDMRPKGTEVDFRCCIHKERAIIKDRIIANLGFAIEEDDDGRTPLSSYAQKSLDRKEIEKKPLTVLDAACKGCVPTRIYITELCQGCIARRCQNTCKFDAIQIIDGRAVIDKDKCKNCKMCMSACPYNAIVKLTVPCEEACPVDAIKKDEQGLARIDFDTCISCGKCTSACPFGAVHEKSQLIDILKEIKMGKNVIALIAPSIVGQLPASVYQLKTAILKAGFSDVYEVAQGADTTIREEMKEFKEKMDNKEELMTTSCCAGYNELVKKIVPEIKPFVSHTKTPAHYIAKKVKEEIKDAITVFVSPCSAKKIEGMQDDNIDYVMNYNELGATLIARKIQVNTCEDTEFDKESSKQARKFGLSGGVAQSIVDASQIAYGNSDYIKPCAINGLNKESIKKLKKYATSKTCEDGNLIEVMCCEGGCIGGNGTLNTPRIAKKVVDELISNSKDIEL